MRVRVVLLLLVLFVMVGSAFPAEAQTTTTVATADEGTSPWVLVVIGATAGAVVGVLTGLARRRRLEREQRKAASPPRD